MKWLFLDIDGVLNNHAAFIARSEERKSPSYKKPDVSSIYVLCPILIGRLNYICENVPGLQIVLSSTWRKFWKLPEFNAYMRKFGYTGPDIGYRTCCLNGAARSTEILMFMWTAGIPINETYCSIDDDRDAMVSGTSYIRTKTELGLTQELAEDCVRVLNDQNTHDEVLGDILNEHQFKL